MGSGGSGPGVPRPAASTPSTSERALAVLLDPALAAIVDLVLRSPAPDVYEAATSDGKVRFRRCHDGRFVVEELEDDDPLDNQAVDHLAGIEAELADPHPPRSRNSYPHAHEQVAQLFDHPAAPDLCVVHTAAHNWEDTGGHRGEHGSLGVVQARAPFVLAGAGVRGEGIVPRAARLVDVGPTVCALLGVEPLADGTMLAGQDGTARDDVLDGPRARHVVVFLLDGANPSVVHALADRGDAPNLERLITSGTSFGYGAMASFPTVTLANHTTILTGRHPGHHGILHNAWYDRRTGEQIVTNSQATWPWSMDHCLPGVESIHHAVHRTWPGSFTASVNEPCDLGADYSTFDFFRRGDVPPIPDAPDGLPHVTERFVRPHKDYAWSSVVDHLGVEQAVGIWDGRYRDVDYPEPAFMFVNFTLTDSAFHIGGPHSEVADASVRDTDARIGDVIAAVERASALDDTAFVLVADHGMQMTDPSVTGNWDDSLRAAGIRFRDEGFGFLYLDED